MRNVDKCLKMERRWERVEALCSPLNTNNEAKSQVLFRAWRDLPAAQEQLRQGAEVSTGCRRGSRSDRRTATSFGGPLPEQGLVEG